MFGWAVWHITSSREGFGHKTSSIIISIASFPRLVKESFLSLGNPGTLVRSDIFPRISGLKVEKKYVDNNYILLSTYDNQKKQSVVKLIRLYDQKVIHQWIPDYDEIIKLFEKKNDFLDDANKHDLRIFHPLISPDGSIIFNNGQSPLIKINKDSKIVWTLNGTFGHSLEYDADGNIWAQSVIEHSNFFQDILKDFKDDAVAKISPNGKLLFQKSVAEILFQNNYKGLLLGGLYEPDLLHVNDVQPALTSARYWMKGDLLISIRHKSTVLLYRPSTNKVIWLKIGPWLNQHDVDFIDSTRIGVFGNDIIRNNSSGLEENAWLDNFLNGCNQEYIYDFKTNEVATPYAELFKKAKIATFTEGRSDILSNGDIFVEETNNNRLLRGNKKDIIWQYVDRINDHAVAALSWSRFITKEEFKKLTFLKNN